MRILVTGGAGFIGRHIAKYYADLGDNVTVVDNLTTSTAQTLPDSAVFYQTDVRDPQFPDLIASIKPQLIVHAAAQASVPKSMSDPQFDRSVNVIGTERVIEGALRVEGCRIVFLSTGGAIYGETQSAAHEETLPRPKSYYGVHKYLAEKCLEFSEVSYGVARLANVYGPGQRSDLEGGVMAIFAEKLLQRAPIHIYGDGEQSRDFVHVTDVVEAISAIGKSHVNDVWNVGSNTELTVSGLVKKMQVVFGSDSPVSYMPARIGDVRKSCLCIDKIRLELGWAPRIGLSEGIRSLR